MKPNTHYPVISTDPNKYLIIRPSSTRVTDNFTMAELYNPRTGLEEHPLSLDTVECMQLIRSATGVPIRPTSTYRNYIPTDGINPATISPHMLGQGIDFSFLGSREENESLYVAIREDFDRKGPLFQALWAHGCRGFGSYDTFIHLDTVRPELYAPFRAKRTTTYQGEHYARWNNMKTLLYRKADRVITPAGEWQAISAEEHPVVAEVKNVVGTVTGTVKELFDNEDQGKDLQVLHLVYLTIAALLSMALLIGGYQFFSSKLNAG